MLQLLDVAPSRKASRKYGNHALCLLMNSSQSSREPVKKTCRPSRSVTSNTPQLICLARILSPFMQHCNVDPQGLTLQRIKQAASQNFNLARGRPDLDNTNRQLHPILAIQVAQRFADNWSTHDRTNHGLTFLEGGGRCHESIISRFDQAA